MPEAIDLRPTFVHACYVGLLGREPDRWEVDHHLGHLDIGDAYSLADMMRAFRQSPEGASLLVPHFQAAMPAVRSIDGRPARHVVALGSHCFTTAHLARAGLRRWASPFDWVRFPPAVARFCLEDDFRLYLDGTMYDGHEHAGFRAAYGLGDMFPHHDLADEAVRAKLRDRVERWRKVMGLGDPTLFVVVTPGIENLQRFRPMLETLQATTARPGLLFVVVEPPDASLPVAQVSLQDSVGCSAVAWRMRPTGELGAMRFDAPMDEMIVHRLIREFWIDA
ncbi:DUF1796 family putative cysteine peptidase [Azospirillum formosense]|uniref:DUF1796 family putative cysteine peptidase n=1 Tax=Azospirillum formosense TaxID=861533 RepID=UPI00338EF7DB